MAGIGVHFNEFKPTGSFKSGEVWEPLFLNPDGARTRYPIGWLGLGRYEPNTLRIFRKGTELTKGTDFSEEANGVFFKFATAQSNTYNCHDYVVSYVPRSNDLNFSKTHNMFLFPRWRLNASGNPLKDSNEIAFWVGKNMASRYDASSTGAGFSNTVRSQQGVVPWVNVTRDNAISYCISSGGHMVKNREYCAIIHWCAHHDFYPAGNSKLGVDGAGVAGTIDTTVSGGTLCGTGPVTWNHNFQSGGIQDIVGNRWEWVPDLEIRSSAIYVAPENFTSSTLVNSGYTFSLTGNTVKYIRNEPVLLEECIPGDSGLAVKGSDYSRANDDTVAFFRFGAFSQLISDFGSKCAGLFSIGNKSKTSIESGQLGFRFAHSIAEAESFY